MYDDVQYVKRSNAELINGLIGMDLGKLSAVGKRWVGWERLNEGRRRGPLVFGGF